MEGSNPASKDSSRRLSRLDAACILIWVFAPVYSLLCSHSTLTAETFPSSVALSACQSELSGDRSGGRSSSSSSGSSSGSSGSRPGGRSFRRHSQGWESASSRSGLSCNGRWPRCWSSSKPRAPIYLLSRGYIARPPQKFWPKKKIKGVTAERGVETWTTDMTSLQLLGAWGDILWEICYPNKDWLSCSGSAFAGILIFREVKSARYRIMKQIVPGIVCCHWQRTWYCM